MSKFRIVSLLFSIIVLFSFLQPVSAAVTAKTLPPGTLFRFSTEKTIYFVASDAKAYPFPDEATFFSWYPSFAKVKVVEKKDVLNVILKNIISLKPGTRVVKFGDDPKLYAIARGARLRWIKNENVLSDLYTTTWRNYFVTLPAIRLNDYSIGAVIDKASLYQKNDERTNVTISQELYARGFARKDTVAPGGAAVPLLKSLTENVKGALSPNFKPQTTYYTLKTDFNEDKITLTSKAYDDYMTIMVGDYNVADGSPITLDIPIGETDIPIKVSSPDGTHVIYTIRMKRAKPGDSKLLSSLTENLSDSFWPTFQPHSYDYTIYAKSSESSIILHAKTEDDKARLTIDGNSVASNASYDKTLKPGENKIELLVTAENGYAQKYTLTVKKVQ